MFLYWWQHMNRIIDEQPMDPNLDEAANFRILLRNIGKEMDAIPLIKVNFYKPDTDKKRVRPKADKEGDRWTMTLSLDKRDFSTALTVTIRPDLSKDETIRILNKIIKKIRRDERNWIRDFYDSMNAFKLRNAARLALRDRSDSQ
jgi:hypothetical protein